MAHYSFIRLADGETIPIVAENEAIALALLGERDKGRFSTVGNGSPEHMFAKSDWHTFWCRPDVPVYRV
jgi:hypothetical protein